MSGKTLRDYRNDAGLTQVQAIEAIARNKDCDRRKVARAEKSGTKDLDILMGMSREYNVPLMDIIEANNQLRGIP